MRNVTISSREYRKLIESWVRISVFADYVRSKMYCVEREECARFLGFSLERAESGVPVQESGQADRCWETGEGE